MASLNTTHTTTSITHEREEPATMSEMSASIVAAPEYPPTPLADRFNVYVTIIQPTRACTPNLMLIFDQQPAARRGTTVWYIRPQRAASGLPMVPSRFEMVGERLKESSRINPKVFLGSFPRQERTLAQEWAPVIVSRIVDEGYLVTEHPAWVARQGIQQIASQLQPFFNPLWPGRLAALELDGFEIPKRA
ncbi:uncharacterized protein DSM5745_10350 [Aspergillus mulundensis]|uniref:Uncharacterized protein n=1 Tax=Aspergillus mulundensis TaxID=1810919 RepID=A0A3D8QN76_9EURO|nr:hypothetical protein DSM5745_10350 [Aspergillus mulundensis]RDW63239.1 hypothetical protein DSM5745_10350 [Aspergillus mulundensis]